MPQRNSLRQTIAALYVVQMASYLAPLLTLPWLTRVLGPEGFGRIAFAVGVTSYFVLISEYGFTLSATRRVAVHRDDPERRSDIFWSTLGAKALLAAAGLPCLLLLTYLVPRLSGERVLLFINYLTVIGAVLTPNWYYLGIERQAFLSTVTVIVRILAVPLTFLIVRSPDHVLRAAAIPCSFSVIVGIVSLLYLARGREVLLRPLTWSGVRESLQDSWHLFVSSASVSLYQATNTVILGFVAGSTAVGHYSAAEKVVQACQSLMSPISAGTYPRVSRLMHESRNEGFALVRKVLKFQGAIAFAISAALFVSAPLVVQILYGGQYAESVTVLRWLSGIPFLVALSTVLGIQTMLALGLDRIVSRISISAGIMNVLILLVLTRLFGAVGAAMSVLITEIFVTSSMALIIKRRKWPVFTFKPAV